MACVVLLSVVAVPSAAADQLKDRRSHVKQQIDRATSQLAHSSARARQATRRLSAARSQLRQARETLDSVSQDLKSARERDERLAGELRRAEGRLAAARDDFRRGQVAVRAKREDVVNTIVGVVQNGDPAMTAMAGMLEADGVTDLIQVEEARDVLVGRTERDYDELVAAQILVGVRQRTVEAARDEAVVEREAAAAALLEVKALRTRARRASVAVKRRVRDQREARQHALRTRSKDARMLRQLRVEEKRIQQRIVGAARRAAKSPSAARVPRPDGSFLEPTAGYISSPFGYRRHPIYGYFSLHDGVDIAAPCGQAVYAPLDGRVMSSYYSDVYGNRLFVNLGFVGGRFLTVVYNHLARASVTPGSAVQRGQVVGVVGNTGWSTGCHLHFTVLARGRAIDPEQFF